MSGDAGFESFAWRGRGKGFSQLDEAFSGRGKRRQQEERSGKGGRVNVVHFYSRMVAFLIAEREKRQPEIFINVTTIPC